MPVAPEKHTCYLALGSNLNHPIQQIKKCLQHLNRLPKTSVVALANLYQSKPWGVENQPDFINTVVKIKTSIKPMALLKAVKTIEYRLMQRKANHRWHSRVIDIDLLLWDNLVLNRDTLTIPHPLISARCFVVQPLMELSPDLPVNLKTQLLTHQKKHHCVESMKLIKTPDFIKNQLKLL
jgi:2-amino-4-hydroxy-6-hydroxymethyldihydropteridine diphosphokinase